MRRLLYVVLVAAMLVIPATAFAGEPDHLVVPPIPDGWWLLGELWWTPDYGNPAFDVWAPYERVDAYMWRPSTCDVWDYDLGICLCADYDFVADVCVNATAMWPLIQGTIMGDWWMTLPESDYRRMSYAEDYWYADMFGGYYAEFMLPRDEVWYPCSFPLKWKCNFLLPSWEIEYHSPAVMAYECWFEGLNLVCLDWPWAVFPGSGCPKPNDESANAIQDPGNPCDTIAPAVIDIGNFENTFPYGFQYELEIAGMFWKYSDIP